MVVRTAKLLEASGRQGNAVEGRGVWQIRHNRLGDNKT